MTGSTDENVCRLQRRLDKLETFKKALCERMNIDVNTATDDFIIERATIYHTFYKKVVDAMHDARNVIRNRGIGSFVDNAGCIMDVPASCRPETPVSAPGSVDCPPHSARGPQRVLL